MSGLVCRDWYVRIGKGGGSGEGDHPVVGVWRSAALDGGEGGAKLGGDGTGGAAADGELATGMGYPSDGRDDRGGTAGEDLGDVPGLDALLPLLRGDPSLLDAQPMIPGQGEQGITGDPGQQSSGELRSYQPRPLALTEDEVEIVGAHLLYPAPLDRIQPHDLVATIVGGLLLDHQRGGVVAGELGCSGTPGRGADVLGAQPDADRLKPVAEVRPRRGGDEQVAIARRRPHS